MPIFIADYVLSGYGTGAIMAVPGQDARDWEFARAFDLPIIRTVQPPEGWADEAYTGDGPAINSGFLDGLTMADAKRAIIAWLEDEGVGEGTVTYKLRDWLFSRQRYWGEPFPIVYDETGLPIALPADQLPVLLPEIDDYAPLPADDDETVPDPPLSRATDWATVELDLGDGPKRYRRELNTMPQWAGSCWYHLRYLDPTNDDGWSTPRSTGTGWAPTASTCTSAASSTPCSTCCTPASGRRCSSTSGTSARSSRTTACSTRATSRRRPTPTTAACTSRPTRWTSTTMASGSATSRSRASTGRWARACKNTVTPDEIYRQYGADTLRLYEMFMGPLDQDRPWDTNSISAPTASCSASGARSSTRRPATSGSPTRTPADEATRRAVHRTIDGVRSDLQALRFNTAIAKITELNNHLTKAYADGAHAARGRRAAGAAAGPARPAHRRGAVVAPGPRRLAGVRRRSRSPIPPSGADTVTMVVQVNGKVRDGVEVAIDITEADALAVALASPKVQAHLAGAEPRKVIVRAPKLVNLVV